MAVIGGLFALAEATATVIHPAGLKNLPMNGQKYYHQMTKEAIVAEPEDARACCEGKRSKLNHWQVES